MKGICNESKCCRTCFFLEKGTLSSIKQFVDGGAVVKKSSSLWYTVYPMLRTVFAQDPFK